MAVTSARSIVNLKKSHFEHENARIDKYTTFRSRPGHMGNEVEDTVRADGGEPLFDVEYIDYRLDLAVFNTLADELPAQLSELGLRPRIAPEMQPKPAYTLRKLTPDDREVTIEFLRRFFFRDEPMNQAIQLLETPESRCEELEDYASSSLSDGVSIAAFDDLGEMVGVVVNGIVTREEMDYTDKSEDCPNPKFRRILKVLGHLDREARIWEKVPEDCNKVLEIRVASTHTTWRGRGLMRILCEETERVARAVGAGALRMDTTSAFSAAAAERLHFRRVFTVLYAELSYAPQPEAPHSEARVYIKNL